MGGCGAGFLCLLVGCLCGDERGGRAIGAGGGCREEEGRESDRRESVVAAGEECC